MSQKILVGIVIGAKYHRGRASGSAADQAEKVMKPGKRKRAEHEKDFMRHGGQHMFDDVPGWMAGDRYCCFYISGC